jgi:hypothetical protein
MRLALQLLLWAYAFVALIGLTFLVIFNAHYFLSDTNTLGRIAWLAIILLGILASGVIRCLGDVVLYTLAAHCIASRGLAPLKGTLYLPYVSSRYALQLCFTFEE